MAISIRRNEQIEGIKIGEHETKYLLYAKVMTATLVNISSGEKVIQTLDNFEKCSGMFWRNPDWFYEKISCWER